MSDKRTVRVVVNQHCDQSDYEGRLVDVIGKLQLHLQDIPEQFRDEAVLEIDYTNSYYDSIDIDIKISYLRPETDQELVSRLEKDRVRYDQQLAYNRENLKRALAFLGKEEVERILSRE